MRLCGTHLRTISQWVPQLLFCIMSLKSILLKLLSHLLGANELITDQIIVLCSLGEFHFFLSLTSTCLLNFKRALPHTPGSVGLFWQYSPEVFQVYLQLTWKINNLLFLSLTCNFTGCKVGICVIQSYLSSKDGSDKAKHNHMHILWDEWMGKQWRYCSIPLSHQYTLVYRQLSGPWSTLKPSLD